MHVHTALLLARTYTAVSIHNHSEIFSSDYSCVWHAKFICTMTHSNVCHAACICVTSRMPIISRQWLCVACQICVRHDAFKCVTRMHMISRHPYNFRRHHTLCLAPFIRVPWHIQTCAITPSYAWYDASVCSCSMRASCAIRTTIVTYDMACSDSCACWEITSKYHITPMHQEFRA